MIFLVNSLLLDLQDQQALQDIQQRVNNGGSYQAQVMLAEQQWKKKPKVLFNRIRIALGDVCPGARRCCYCEDSLADEIEHIRPKNWFPNQAFVPDNFLFACGPCNGPKGSSYAIIDALGVISKAIRPKNGPIVLPPVGQEALLHPRIDNPSNYFFIDLVNTFQFKPHNTLNANETKRAEYTIQMLRLNKEPLLKAWKEAFKDFACRFISYYLSVCEAMPSNQLERLKNELLQKQHITVWREMQRQFKDFPYLKQLFELVPGAERW